MASSTGESSSQGPVAAQQGEHCFFCEGGFSKGREAPVPVLLRTRRRRADGTDDVVQRATYVPRCKNCKAVHELGATGTAYQFVGKLVFFLILAWIAWAALFLREEGWLMALLITLLPALFSSALITALCFDHQRAMPGAVDRAARLIFKKTRPTRAPADYLAFPALVEQIRDGWNPSVSPQFIYGRWRIFIEFWRGFTFRKSAYKNDHCYPFEMESKVLKLLAAAQNNGTESHNPKKIIAAQVVDVAQSSAITKPSVSVRDPSHPAHSLALEASKFKGEKRLELINQALALCPGDGDLLFAKACSLDVGLFENGAQPVLQQLKRLHPNYPDIMLRRESGPYTRQIAEGWLGGAGLESWSEQSTELEGLMSSRLNQGQHVQVVRHCLVPTVAIVYRAEREFCQQIDKMRWDLKWASTPYGNIAVHYVIMLCVDGHSARNEAFLPHGMSHPPFLRDGYFLLRRLALSECCFLVLADRESKVLRNQLFEFPDSLKRTLCDCSQALQELGPARNPRELIDGAAKWYMESTDVASITY